MARHAQVEATFHFHSSTAPRNQSLPKRCVEGGRGWAPGEEWGIPQLRASLEGLLDEEAYPGLKAQVPPPLIVPEAFGSVLPAERTQSPVPNIPRIPTWKLRAGHEHLNSISLHDAFLLRRVKEEETTRPALRASGDVVRTRPGERAYLAETRALTQRSWRPFPLRGARSSKPAGPRSGSPGRETSHSLPLARPSHQYPAERELLKAPLGHSCDRDLSAEGTPPPPPPPSRDLAAPRQRSPAWEKPAAPAWNLKMNREGSAPFACVLIVSPTF